MLNNFKATVRKWAGLPWAEFRDLLTWPCKSTLQTDNPHLLIASVKSATGKTVCFATAEPIFLIDGYVCSPESTPSEAQRGGDAVDLAFASEAQKAGVGRMLIVLPTDSPNEPGEKWLRVIERKVPQAITTQQRIGCLDSDLPTATFIN